VSAPAFLLIHGYPFDHAMWDGVAAAILRAVPGARVLAPDLPGFGKRPPPAPEHAPSLDALADDLSSTLDKAGIDEAIVAGMSMGGYVALALAERHGGCVAGLALIDSRAAADANEARAGRRRMIEKIRAAGPKGPEEAARAALPKLFAPGRDEDPAYAQYALDGAAKAGARGLCYALEAMARRPDRTQALRDLALRGVPITIVHGTADRFIPLDEARTLAREIGARFVEVPGAGHAAPVEDPAAVAAAIVGLRPDG
jgi:pimeloyl-ACP methyl ester carboxylesterase